MVQESLLMFQIEISLKINLVLKINSWIADVSSAHLWTKEADSNCSFGKDIGSVLKSKLKKDF